MHKSLNLPGGLMGWSRLGTAVPALLLICGLSGAGETPEEIACRYAETHLAASAGYAGATELVRTSSVEGPSGTRVNFEPSRGGIPIFESEMSIHVLRDGQVDDVRAPVACGLARTTVPLVGKVAAEQSWRLFLHARLGRDDFPATTSLVYLPEGPDLLLCWRVQVSTPEGAWLFLVSAEEPGITYLVKRLAADEITGTGQVYAENPKKNKQPETVQLPHLDATHSLKGNWVRTFNANGIYDFTSGFQTSRYTTAASPNDRYVYDRSDKPFTEVMAYYHVTRLHDYLAENSLARAVNGQIPVVVNVQDPSDTSHGYDNAFYTRDYRYASTGMLVFGSGYKYHNFAEDSDILYHEYGHAVLDRIDSGLIANIEHVFSGAIHEATGDVIAAHMNGNSKLAEWGLSLRSSGKWLGRDVNNHNRYPEDVKDPEFGQAEVHHTGLILGGLFWQMRRDLGPDIAIQLYFDTLDRLGPKADFFDFRDSLLKAEKELDHNAHLDALNAILVDRGLDGADPGNKQATVSIAKMQTRHFDWDAFQAGSLSESFTPGTWIALTATLDVANAGPGYYMLPRLGFIFPPDIGTGGYEAYYLINEEQEGSQEYVEGLLYSPDYAAAATLGWRLRCRLGDQKKLTAFSTDYFQIE